MILAFSCTALKFQDCLIARNVCKKILMFREDYFTLLKTFFQRKYLRGTHAILTRESHEIKLKLEYQHIRYIIVKQIFSHLKFKSVNFLKL